eukprot:6172209-Pleurochrysis_carterae.AAC.1
MGAAAAAAAMYAGSSSFNLSKLTFAGSGGTSAKAFTPAGVRCVAANNGMNARTTRHTCILTHMQQQIK